MSGNKFHEQLVASILAGTSPKEQIAEIIRQFEQGIGESPLLSLHEALGSTERNRSRRERRRSKKKGR